MLLGSCCCCCQIPACQEAVDYSLQTEEVEKSKAESGEKGPGEAM